jgi:hypothetical protein
MRESVWGLEKGIFSGQEALFIQKIDKGQLAKLFRVTAFYPKGEIVVRACGQHELFFDFGFSRKQLNAPRAFPVLPAFILTINEDKFSSDRVQIGAFVDDSVLLPGKSKAPGIELKFDRKLGGRLTIPA